MHQHRNEDDFDVIGRLLHGNDRLGLELPSGWTGKSEIGEHQAFRAALSKCTTEDQSKVMKVLLRLLANDAEPDDRVSSDWSSPRRPALVKGDDNNPRTDANRPGDIFKLES